MKALFVIASLATAALAGCTVYEPGPYSYSSPPRVAYVTPGSTTTYVTPAYNAVVVP